MRALTRAPRVMGVIGAVLGLLPMVCKRWLVNWWGGVFYIFATQALALTQCNVADTHEAFNDIHR